MSCGRFRWASKLHSDFPKTTGQLEDLLYVTQTTSCVFHPTSLLILKTNKPVTPRRADKPLNGGSWRLWNVGTHLPDCTSHYRKTLPSGGGGRRILIINYQLFTHFCTVAYITERGPRYNYQTLLPDLKEGIKNGIQSAKPQLQFGILYVWGITWRMGLARREVCVGPIYATVYTLLCSKSITILLHQSTVKQKRDTPACLICRWC
jgi:hypothetical protein